MRHVEPQQSPQVFEKVRLQSLKGIVRHIQEFQILLELEQIPLQLGQLVVIEAEFLELVQPVESSFGQLVQVATSCRGKCVQGKFDMEMKLCFGTFQGNEKWDCF